MAPLYYGFIFSILSRKLAAACAWSSVKFSKCRKSRSAGRLFSEMIQNLINLIKGLIEDTLKLLYNGFRILKFSIFFGLAADFREHLLKNRRFYEYREIVKFFFDYSKIYLTKNGTKMPIFPFHSVYAYICEENVRKIGNLWVHDVLSTSKKRHVWPKFSILTLFCLPHKKFLLTNFLLKI